MKKCTQCGYGNSPAAKYCANCGTKLSIQCPQCGTMNNPEARFCQECGSRIIPESVDKGDQPEMKISRKEAERRQLTILFCDLVGSTPLSEQLDPEDYRQVITGYHQVAEQVITKNGGHVAQYLGDGLLVYFGYPRGLEDAPRVSVKTGLGILEAIADANREWQAAGRIPVNIRIGIHTGLVVVDDHLALGEAVNVAARLEGLAPQNGLVISTQTNKLTYGWFEVLSLGKHTLKGISEPMEIYQVLHESGAVTRLDVAKSRGLSPLVGRKNELDILNRYWGKAKNGKSNIILLYGEAGIGKSRLVDALEEQVIQESGTILATGRGSSYQQNSPFFPIYGMLEKYIFRFKDEDDPEQKQARLEECLKNNGLDFNSTVSLIGEFLSIPSEKYPPLAISPYAKRQKTMESLSQILIAQARSQPMLFILEDLHWFDASTLQWFNLFINNIENENLLILCTTRPGLKAEWLDREGITRINLQRLSSENTAEICLYQSQGKTLPEEILNQITSKTEGVPLFVEELTKTILESDILVEKENTFEIAGLVSSLAIPSTLQDSLLARLDRLDEIKEVVQVGSVLGREFNLDILQAILPKWEDNLEKSIKKLIDAEIIYQTASGNKLEYQFKHALIQDTAYDSLLKTKRQRMHEKVADVLANQFPDTTETRPELLAHHYSEGGKPLQAIPLWLKAGQISSQKNATDEAIAHLKKGLELLHHVEVEKDRIALEFEFLTVLGISYINSLGYPHPKVKETFHRAMNLAQNMEVNPKLAVVLLGLLSYYFNTEEYKTANELMNYMTDLGKNPNSGYYFNLPVIHLEGTVDAIQGNIKEAIKKLRKAIKIYDPAQVEYEKSLGFRFRINSEAWLSIALQISGYMDQARAISQKHMKYVKEFKSSHDLYHLYTFPALRSLIARDWKFAVNVMESYLPIVRKFGDPVFTITAEVYYNIALAFQGDQKAFKTAIHMINVCFDIGFKAFASTLSPFIAEKHFLNSDNGAALNWIEKILTHVNHTGSHIQTAELYRLKGLVFSAMGKSDEEVEENLFMAIKLAKKQSAKVFELRATKELAIIWKKQGKSEKGYKMLKKVYEQFTEGHDSIDLLEAREILISCE